MVAVSRGVRIVGSGCRQKNLIFSYYTRASLRYISDTCIICAENLKLGFGVAKDEIKWLFPIAAV